jgi:hypothetical protein
VYDGRYAYFVPYYNGTEHHGYVTRVDLDSFGKSGAVSFINLRVLLDDLSGFEGGFLSNRYLYLTQNKAGVGNYIVRIDINDFSIRGTSYMDLSIVDPLLSGFIGGVHVSKGFSFISPSTNGNLARFYES